MTLETRLQLDNKKDLEFVFEGIVKEAEQLCCSPKVLEIVQNVSMIVALLIVKVIISKTSLCVETVETSNVVDFRKLLNQWETME